MRVSTKGKYGLRALLELALIGGDNPVSVKSIAQRQEISEKYLEHLFAEMKKAGLVQSVRGPQGGYRLARPASEISIGDVLKVMEGPVELSSCTSPMEKLCAREGSCAMQLIWDRLSNSIAELLEQYTLEDICEEHNRMQGKGIMYYI